MKNFGVSIGIILGMMAVSLGLYLMNRVVYKGNDVTKALPAYINSSVQLKASIPDADPDNAAKQFDFNFKTYKRNIREDKNGNVCQILFYSKENNKYFNILLYDNDRANEDLIILNIPNQQAIITVNKDELNNPLYGLKDSPVPVFKFDVLSPKNDYPCLHTTQEQYTYNVTQYLRFVMPKEEFNVRFGKK